MSFPAIAIPARIPGCMVRKRGGMVIGPDGCGFDMRSPSEMEADDARREADEAAHAPRMAVTSRIRRVVQPEGGYLPLSLFDEVCLADPVPLYAFEDVPADVTGLAVDYLSRVARGVPARDAFRVPLAGARLAVFSIVGRDDEFGFANVEYKLPELEKVLGKENVSVRIVDGLGHGFGIGNETKVKNWLQEAVIFWEAHR